MRVLLNKLTQKDKTKMSVLLNIHIAKQKFHNFNDLGIRCMHVSTSKSHNTSILMS